MAMVIVVLMHHVRQALANRKRWRHPLRLERTFVESAATHWIQMLSLAEWCVQWRKRETEQVRGPTSSSSSVVAPTKDTRRPKVSPG